MANVSSGEQPLTGVTTPGLPVHCALIVRVFLMGTTAKEDFISLFPLIAPERRSRAPVNPYGTLSYRVSLVFLVFDSNELVSLEYWVGWEIYYVTIVDLILLYFMCYIFNGV